MNNFLEKNFFLRIYKKNKEFQNISDILLFINLIYYYIIKCRNFRINNIILNYKFLTCIILENDYILIINKNLLKKRLIKNYSS